MYVGDRSADAETMTGGLPATPGEDERDPPSGTPATGSLDRRVDAPLGHLIISLHLRVLEAPCQSLAALRRLPLETLWRMLLATGAQGGGKTWPTSSGLSTNTITPPKKRSG